MGVKDELLADQEEQARLATRKRCRTCTALDELGDEDRAEIEDAMTDKSFQDASIARWLSAHSSQEVRKDSVATHRTSHLD